MTNVDRAVYGLLELRGLVIGQLFFRHSDFVIDSSFVLRHSSFMNDVLTYGP